MIIKILQLNILKGIYLDRVIDFASQEKFDILQLQEVSGGKFSDGGVYYIPNRPDKNITPTNQAFIGIDCMKVISENLHMHAELAATLRLIHDEKSYLGNATFFRRDFELREKYIEWLKAYNETQGIHNDPRENPRAALSLLLNISGKDLRVINTHMAWGPKPIDEDYKLVQGIKLRDYITLIDEPFVLSGDFNVPPSSQIIKWMDKLAVNHIKNNKITNTINYRVHKSAHEIFPPGLAVDYFFTSKNMQVKSFKLIDDLDLSDHFGLSLEIEV